MKKVKERVKSAHTMISNSWVILKFAYKANKFLYFVKIPLMVFTAFFPYISMIFIR